MYVVESFLSVYVLNVCCDRFLRVSIVWICLVICTSWGKGEWYGKTDRKKVQELVLFVEGEGRRG